MSIKLRDATRRQRSIIHELDSARFEVQFVCAAWGENAKISLVQALNDLFVTSAIPPCSPW